MKCIGHMRAIACLTKEKHSRFILEAVFHKTRFLFKDNADKYENENSFMFCVFWLASVPGFSIENDGDILNSDLASPAGSFFPDLSNMLIKWSCKNRKQNHEMELNK